jgi:hypothetical protein
MDQRRFGIVIAPHTCDGIGMTFVAPLWNVLTVAAATSFHQILSRSEQNCTAESWAEVLNRENRTT